MGNALKGSTHLHLGAVANPGAPDLDKEIARMGDKVEDGATFFQTQAVYEPEIFAKFMERPSSSEAGDRRLHHPQVRRHGRRLNETLPGVSVPEALIEEMDAAEDKSAKSIEIGGRIIAASKTCARACT